MKKISIIFLLMILFLTSCKTKKCKKDNDHIDNPPLVEDYCKYQLSEDEKYYIVTGISNRDVVEITIKGYYNNKQVKEIANDAFKDCKKLEKVTIEEGVLVISAYSFSGCKNLYQIKLPSSLVTIRNFAFLNCYRLVEIYNMSKISIIKGDKDNGSIGLYAKNIHKSLDDESSVIKNNGFYFVEDEDKVCYLFNYTGNETKILIDSKVEDKNYILADNAFYQTEIKEVTMENIKVIPENCFKECYYLEKITINGVEQIKTGAFESCYLLLSIKIPNTLIKKDEKVFDYCYRLVEIVNLSNISVLDGEHNLYVKDVYDTESYNSKINYTSDGFIFYVDEDIYLLGNTKINSELELPESYLGKEYTINCGAFINQTQLTRVVIPDTIKFVGDSAFENCKNLMYLVIGKNIETIGYKSFYNCVNLRSIVLPKSLKFIGEYAFSYCYRLAEIYNLSNISISLGSNDNGSVGLYCKIIQKDETDESNVFRSVDGYIFAFDGSKYYLIGYEGNEVNLKLPEFVGGEKYEVSTGAFFEYDNIKSIEICDDVSKIGNFAFAGCSSLERLFISDQVESIGNFALYECYSLEALEFNTLSNWSGSSLDTIIIYASALKSPYDNARIFKTYTSYKFNRLK